MHTDCWIQQVTTRVGAVTCWIQQSVSPKQVVGFTCVFNSEIDQLIRKFTVDSADIEEQNQCSQAKLVNDGELPQGWQERLSKKTGKRRNLATFN